MGGKDLVPPSSQIYGESGSLIITDGGVHVKTHKNLTMGPSFLKPFFALAGTFFRWAFRRKFAPKKQTLVQGASSLESELLAFFRRRNVRATSAVVVSCRGARENLTRSNVVGDMKQTDKFVKGQLFNLQRT